MSGEGWQDIASAPRDGTVVLAYGECDGEINGLYGYKECAVATLETNGTAWLKSSDAYSVQVHATHWCALPSAPSASPAPHTVTIDTVSEPGSWARALRHSGAPA